MNNKIEIVSAGISEKGTIENLFVYYIYEMSDLLQTSASEIGLLEPRQHNLKRYWESDNHYPYLIRCNGEIAGFSLLRKYPNDPKHYDIDQFFVLKKFSRRGVGREAFKQSVAALPGSWITRVLLENKKALAFWLSVIPSVTDNKFVHSIEIDGDLPMHFIRFQIKPG